ncbi:MAG: hypothetical protein ACREQ5_25375 [Candidatus Dormibacteria bacterium]
MTLAEVAANFTAQGSLRIRSPRMHDDVNGIRVLSETDPLSSSLSSYFDQTVYSQDTLTVEAVFTVAPAITDVSIGLMTFFYDDLPGVAGNYRSWAEVGPNVVDYLVVPVTPTGSATLGDWGAGVAINSTIDVFKANTLYALLGYDCPVAFGGVSVAGVDVGNLQIGGPGSTLSSTTRDYFCRLGESVGKPSIPIINSQNKATTLVAVCDDVASTAVTFSLIFAQLSA